MTEEERRREDIARRRVQTEAMLMFSRVHQQILRRSADRLAAAGIDDITPARANALIVLFNARGAINAQALAAELGISDVTVSRLLRKMEDDGWVERVPDPDDGRAMLLRTTPMAREMFPTLVRVSNAVLDDLFGQLSDAELQQLTHLVDAVQDGLG